MQQESASRSAFNFSRNSILKTVLIIPVSLGGMSLGGMLSLSLATQKSDIAALHEGAVHNPHHQNC